MENLMIAQITKNVRVKKSIGRMDFDSYSERLGKRN